MGAVEHANFCVREFTLHATVKCRRVEEGFECHFGSSPSSICTVFSHPPSPEGWRMEDCAGHRPMSRRSWCTDKVMDLEGYPMENDLL